MSARVVAGALVLVLSGVTAGVSSLELHAIRGESPEAAQVLYLPSGKYLRIVSLGFREVLADLIYIWSIQYYGNYHVEDRFTYIEHIYANVISELDPEYIDPYLIGALIMSIEAKDDEMALRLLDKGIAANPDEWLLAFEAGFTAYNSLGDFERAAGYFETAMRCPEAPSVIGRLHAEMFNRLGDKSTSLKYWRRIYEEAEQEYVRDVAWHHVHDLSIEVDLENLQGAVGEYRARHGRLPSRLEDLVVTGILSKLPRDPEGAPYSYDATTGRVETRSRYRLYRGEGN